MEEYDKLAVEYIKRKKGRIYLFPLYAGLKSGAVRGKKDCPAADQEPNTWQLLHGATFIPAISL